VQILPVSGLKTAKKQKKGKKLSQQLKKQQKK